MAARPRVKRVDLRGQSLDGVELFAKYHIIGLRHSKTGYVRQVKHVQLGWMSPEDYYHLQKLHDAIPLIQTVLEGGYRLKWALANVTVEGIPIIGASMYGWALARAAALLLLPDGRDEASFLLTGVLAPFGEVLLLWAIVRNSTFQPVNWAAFLRWAAEAIAPARVPGGPVPHPR